MRIAALDELIARLKTDIARDGGVTVGGEDLQLLCPENLSASEQFMRIASLAQAEHWSFAFLPGGSVRFGSYGQA